MKERFKTLFIRFLIERETEDPLTPAADKERESFDANGKMLFIEAKTKEILGNGIGKGTAFNEWLDELDKDQKTNDVLTFVTQISPFLVSCIRLVAPVNECHKLREQFGAVTRATCKAFGSSCHSFSFLKDFSRSLRSRWCDPTFISCLFRLEGRSVRKQSLQIWCHVARHEIDSS